MRISIGYTGSLPLADTLEAVQEAESCQLDGVWSAEHVGLNDAVVPTAFYASRTSTLELGLVGLNVNTRHVGTLAMELATLASVAGDRLRIQVGTGSPDRARRIGVTRQPSLRTVEMMVHHLRALLAGETVSEAEGVLSMSAMAVRAPGFVPAVDLMAIGPRMTSLAARVGDGISITVGASRGYLAAKTRDVERLLDEHGRTRAGFRITAFVLASIHEDLSIAQRQLAEVVCQFPLDKAGQLRPEFEAPNTDAVKDALARGGLSAAADLFSADLIEGFGIAATPSMLPEVLDAYAHTGVDEVALMLVGDPAGHRQTVRDLGQAQKQLATTTTTGDHRD